MSTPPCSECGGTRWVRYFSETMQGDLEEAFRLCSCNHKSDTRGERSREEPERTETEAVEVIARVQIESTIMTDAVIFTRVT